MFSISKTKKMYSFIFGILTIILPSILSATKQLPVETHFLWERDYYYIAPCDFNRDSIDDLILILEDFAVQPVSQNLNDVSATRVFEKGTFKKGVSKCGALDQENIWVSYKINDSLFISDLWSRRAMFITTGIDIASPKGWDGIVDQAQIVDINKDGQLEIVVNADCGWDRKPRGIFVFDWQTGKFLWKYLCGPVIEEFFIKDIDSDGKYEILCETNAPGNGNVDNETADWFTYVFILNSDGTLRWIKQIGVYSSEVKANWIENKQRGKLEVVVVEKGCSAGERICDSIYILDAYNGQVQKSAQYGNFNGNFTVAHDQKRTPFIIIGGMDDTLRILDENLKLLYKCSMNGMGCINIAVSNFTGGNQDEIAVQTTSGQVNLYNLRLKLLSIYSRLENTDEWSLVKFYNKTRLLYRTSRKTWQLLEFNRIPLLNRRVPIASVILGAIILLLLFTIGMVYARYTKTRDIRMVIRGLTGQGGMIELNKKGEIINVNNRIREILEISDKQEKWTLNTLSNIKQLGPVVELVKFILSEPSAPSSQEVVITLTQDKYYLVRCIRVKTGVLIAFEDISAVEYMKRVTTWTPVAQKLAHGIKNPLSTILGAVEQMEIKCQENGVKKYVGYVKDEVTKLKKMSDAFMRFTKSAPAILEPKNINEIIKKIMAKYEPLWERGVRSEKRGDIKVEYELSEKLPKINVDEEGISNALNIIIENAIESMSPSPLSMDVASLHLRSALPVKGEGMKKGGILRIRTIPDERLEKEVLKQYIRIEISDTGAGIPEKYLEKVFDPYFTYNKPLGTGLGLTLAKKIIEDHKGYIEINSKESVGTQVNIYLPIK